MAIPLDVQEYLIEKVKEEDEDFELREGSVFVDFFIKPLIIILQPIRNEIEVVRFLQSLQNFAVMSAEDLDALLANIFLTRSSGTKSIGTARLFFAAPQSASVSQNTAAITATGLRFLADSDVTITESAMSVNVDGSLYFLDFPVTAEAPGVEYDIDQGLIIALEVPVSGVVRVTNLAKFSGGLATESNLEYFNRGQTAVTVRNLINDRSIPTVLLEKFSFIKSLTPIGFNDPEMGRARLEILLPGPPQHTVVIPDRGGHADVYMEGDAFEERSTTVQTAPQIVGTNAQRGIVTELDVGFRNISVKPGFFLGIEYPGDHLVQLLPNLRYTLYLTLAPSGDKYELATLTTAVANPYPAVPGGDIPIANLQTDGASVVALIDIRQDVFQFERPVISMDSAELLDPVSLQPTGIVLRDGLTPLIPPSVVATLGSQPHMALSRGSGDVHFVYKKVDGVYYQRLDSLGSVVQAEVQIATDVNASNIKLSVTLQENINVFFLDFPGNVRHLQIDNTGGVLVAEGTISGAGTTLELDVHTDKTGFANVATINDNAGQPDLYFIRVDQAGAVATAQVLMQSTLGDAAAPCVASSHTSVPDLLNNDGNTGVTNGTAVFTDANATFITDGAAPGDLFVLYAGTGLPLSEQGIYPVLTVDFETQVTFSGAPTITAATGIDYEVIQFGGLLASWLDDISGNKNVRAFEFSTAGVPNGPPSGEHVVLSDPTDSLENTIPKCYFHTGQTPAVGPGWTIVWVSNGTELQIIGSGDFATFAVSSTGDTQGTGLSRIFLDASNPFVPTDVGKFISITQGSGLTDQDFRLYKILEYVSAGQVLLEVPVTDSTAADIEYSIAEISQERRALSPNFFLSQITALDTVVDNSNQLHIALIETEGNQARTFMGKFDELYRPLLRPVFLRISASVNNRASISIEVDQIRQPYLSWDDFSASLATVQFAKFQAQEFAYLVNKPAESLSNKEDASIILDPTLVGQSIRFNYMHSARVPEVDTFVNGTVNRVVIGNYCTRHTMPAYVDVSIEYSGDGAPDEDTALELLTDFINEIGSQAAPPSEDAVITQTTEGDQLEKADLLDVLYDAGADSARVDSEILTDETQQDGTFRTFRSIDQVIITRTARFIARDIAVTRV